MAFVRNSWNWFELHVVQSKGMSIMSGTAGNRLLLLGALLCIGLITAGYVTYQFISRSHLDTRLSTPRPPLVLQPSRFPCLESLARGRGTKRLAVLHGPDWTLESTVQLKCFPEREVGLTIEEGRHFMGRPATRNTMFWILKSGDLIYARIVESSGDEKLDLDALDLVSNHQCGPKNTKNCRVQSARMVFRY